MAAIEDPEESTVPGGWVAFAVLLGLAVVLSVVLAARHVVLRRRT